jgi:hypothetical protein
MAGEKSAIAVVLSKKRITSLNVSLINPPSCKASSPQAGLLCHQYIVGVRNKRKKRGASS